VDAKPVRLRSHVVLRMCYRAHSAADPNHMNICGKFGQTNSYSTVLLANIGHVADAILTHPP